MNKLALGFVLFCLLAPASLLAGGASDTLDKTEGDGVEFTGRLDILGSMPHLSGVIRLEDGRVYLVDPQQMAKLAYGTGSYRFTAVLSPPRPAMPGLGIPRHDKVAHILSATALSAR